MPAGDKTTSDSARSAARARWANTSPEERSRIASANARAMHAKRGHATPTPTAVTHCPYCGVEMRGARRKQCGASKCRRQFNASRQVRYMHERRARMLDNEWESFDPVEIYERDGWTCGICGLLVDKTIRERTPQSVSLDHVVPVSLGGSHTRDNTRCAHFGCNSKRGNRVTFGDIFQAPRVQHI